MTSLRASHDACVGYDDVKTPLSQDALSDSYEIESQYLDSVVEDILFDEAIEFMWLIRTGQLSLEELYCLAPAVNAVEPAPLRETLLKTVEEPPPSTAVTSSSSSGSSWMNKTVICQLCKESVAGVRYAPHLERCMNGGKRGARRHYDYLHDTSAGLPYYNSKPKAKKEFVDPHPESLVLRFRVKNGALVGPINRHGATLEEFQEAQQNLQTAVENGTWIEGTKSFYIGGQIDPPSRKR